MYHVVRYHRTTSSVGTVPSKRIGFRVFWEKTTVYVACCLIMSLFFFFSINLSLLSPSVNVSGSYVQTIVTAENILTWRGTIPPKQYFLHAFCIQHQCYCSYSKSNKYHEEDKMARFRLLQNHYVKDMIIGSWIQEGEIEILRHQAYQIFLPPSTHHTLTLAVCANFFPFLFSFIV